MKVINNERYLTIGEVADMIKRGSQTIKNWYAWAEEAEKLELLPVVHTDLDAKGTRYFKESDIPALEHFRDNIQYGQMAEYSQQRWGKRGQEIAKKKDEGSA